MSRAQQIEQTAAHWVLLREEPEWSAADEAQLQAWLTESDAHKVAYWRLEAGWREADRIASIGAAADIRPRRFGNFHRWVRPLAIAASLLLVFTLLVLQTPNLPFEGSASGSQAEFETAVGGHKIVSLGDGSRVELNTDTAIKASVNDQGRAVWLNRGEAFFDVARQPGQAFVIYAGARTITVLGTKFSVRRTGRDVVVAVLEGRVRVEDSPSARFDGETTITAGDVAIARDGSTVVQKSADAVHQQLAWRNGLLLFDGVTLASAAEQFNRYNRKQLVLGDADLSGLRVEGRFQARKVDSFARMLEQAYGLDVRSTPGQVILSSKRFARASLPKQLRPDLFTPRPRAVPDSAPGCAQGGECAVIPLSGPPPAPAKAPAPNAAKAARDANNWNILHKLYPARALAAGEEGLVGFTVKIDGRGDPTSCKITHTSGHPLLDLETCKLIMVHATFKRPAGATPSQQRSYEGVVNWKLPTSPLAAVPAPPKPIAQAKAPAELICKRVVPTGSNIASERYCMSKSEWEQLSEDSKRPFEERSRNQRPQ